jgi:hypothetical protein
MADTPRNWFPRSLEPRDSASLELLTSYREMPPVVKTGSARSFTCPWGHTLVLAAVSYSNITLADTNNGLTDNLRSISRTFFNV